MQRILGFNRWVPWPVHFTAPVHNYKNTTCDFSKRSACPGFSANCYIQARNSIIIDGNTKIGPGVSIISSNHDTHDLKKHTLNTPFT